MKCPNCGNEVKGKVCKYCHTDLPFDERIVSLKQFAIKFVSIVNGFLLPPAKIAFVFWTFCWISNSLDDHTISVLQKMIVILLGYIFLCGIADLIYICNKKRYLSYKLKVSQKETARLKKLLDKYYPYKSLLDEANELVKVVNTTTDKENFECSYNRLIKIFTELKKYERLGIFTNSPTEDLNNLIYSREAATRKFYERSKKTSSSLDNSSISYQASENADPYFIDAARLVIQYERASIGMLQRRLKIGFNRATRIMNQLEEATIVGPEEGTYPRRVLMSIEQFDQYLKNDKFHFSSSDSNILSDRKDRITLYNNKYDYMEGHDFEYFCADLLKGNGFSNVEVTQGSGDHGIDILAEKYDISYAIQCKCYSSNVGNAAVQQAHTGKSLYHKDVAVVLTNQYFTQQAKEEANTLGVKLWDRDKLQEMIKIANN